MWWWPFVSEKTYKESEMFEGMTDWHSHILPGVDDGVQNMEDALNVLKQYEHLKISDVWLTPHIMEDVPNETAHLKNVFDELQENYAKVHRSSEYKPVSLHLASENMLDNLFMQRLKNKDFLPIGKNHDHLLIETSYVQAPNRMEDMIKGVQDAGYYPILAHPERYFYMHGQEYRKLHDELHVKFQMNIPSLAGLYGPEAKRRAKLILESGYYDFVGTDLHGLRKFFAAITEYKIAKKHLQIIQSIVENAR